MTDENEDILSSDENNLISIRRKKLSEIRTKRQAFPNNFKKSVSSSWVCLLYTSPSPRDGLLSRMPSSA